MKLSPETLAAKAKELKEALAKRDAVAGTVNGLKNELKVERASLARLESQIRELALEVATGESKGDQLPLLTEPGSAAERTIPFPLEDSAETDAVGEPKDKAPPKKAAKRGKKDRPTRALGDVIDGVLRKLRGWLDEAILEASVRGEMSLGAQPSERDWASTLASLLEEGRIERREAGGRVLYRAAEENERLVRGRKAAE